MLTKVFLFSLKPSDLHGRIFRLNSRWEIIPTLTGGLIFVSTFNQNTNGVIVKYDDWKRECMSDIGYIEDRIGRNLL
jgi:hypothetical protein